MNFRPPEKHKLQCSLIQTIDRSDLRDLIQDASFLGRLSKEKEWSLKAHLNSRFRQVDFERDLFSHKDVRVACLGEQRLQDVELRAGESGPLPALLSRSV